MSAHAGETGSLEWTLANGAAVRQITPKRLDNRGREGA